MTDEEIKTQLLFQETFLQINPAYHTQYPYDNKTHVMMRLLCPFKLDSSATAPIKTNVVVHFHGGGFVADDSFVH